MRRDKSSLNSNRGADLLTLILTFSLTEKELPLPEGEGWGEGHEL